MTAMRSGPGDGVTIPATMPYGFVLVGGRSARMGRDKTRLPYRGVPMALHQAEKLAVVCGRVALVGKDPEAFGDSRFPYVLDEAPEAAAACGVAAALAFSPEETNLVLAADVPRCPESFLAALLDVAEAIHAPAVVPVSGGRAQPLCAVWRRSALAVLRSRLGAKDYSLVDALHALRAVLIPEEVTAAMAGGAPENFFNVNTPEEYEALEREAAAEGRAGAAAQPPRR
jgi:molybdenum cofactor guanylyltransferase